MMSANTCMHQNTQKIKDKRQFKVMCLSSYLKYHKASKQKMYINTSMIIKFTQENSYCHKKLQLLYLVNMITLPIIVNSI